MSMQNWMNDAQSFQGNDNGSFNPGGDPSMPFMQTPTTSGFDFNHMQNPQLHQQQMPNGGMRNGSPGYNNPMYQTQTMIPSKRPRPREDSIGASPQQHPGNLPASRSQTPQGPYQGFPGAVNGGQQFPGAAMYQQFQPVGNHASPSPVVQNQAFNSQPPHQRVQTMSPSPFSPATQNFNHQASPPQSEDGSRVNTPQNGAPQYGQSVPYAGNPNQPFAPPVGSQMNGGGLAQYNQHLQAQHQQQQQRMNEIRMRQMQQQRYQAGMVNSVPQPPNQISAQQMAVMRARHAQQAQSRQTSPEQLLRMLQQWAAQRGQQFNLQPTIMGRHISSFQLFTAVLKMGGSEQVTAQGKWANIANAMQFQGPQLMGAAQELQNYWQTNLAMYEELFSKHRQALGNPSRAASQGQNGDYPSRQEAFSPTRQSHNPQPNQLAQPPPHMQAPFQTPVKPMSLSQNDGRPPMQNGYLDHQPGSGPGQTSNVYTTPQSKQSKLGNASRVRQSPKKDPWPTKTSLPSEFEPVSDPQGVELERSWGGYEIGPKSPFIETVDSLLRYKLTVPKLEELGLIDVRSLTLSLRSGMHAEVRLALDTLASLTSQYPKFDLGKSDDLLETLIDCADEQVQLLADNSAEVSDEMFVLSYEDVIRGCKIENATLQEITEFGTLDHDLDRAADKLICVTTIVRNLSGLPNNQPAIADSVVVRFMATVIRYIGTRSMLLRTYRNLLDFSKDILSVLANVGQHIDLPGKEEALCILHFLLAFAPSPNPHSHEGEGVTFASYMPECHRYYPLAVDSMAKLLARGDPNRDFYRIIFTADAASSPPFDLLTRSFGLAIAALPEIGNNNAGSLLKVRLPYLLQGLLAAEILAGVIPSTDHELAASWLASQDGFALVLIRIATELGQQPPMRPQRHLPEIPPDPDPLGHATIAERGFAILRRLTDRARDMGGKSKELPHGILPNKQSVIHAMKIPTIPPTITRQLCALSSLDT